MGSCSNTHQCFSFSINRLITDRKLDWRWAAGKGGGVNSVTDLAWSWGGEKGGCPSCQRWEQRGGWGGATADMLSFTGRRAGWASAEEGSRGTPSGSCGASPWPRRSSGWSPPVWRRPPGCTGSWRWSPARSPTTGGQRQSLPATAAQPRWRPTTPYLVCVVWTGDQQEDPGEGVLGGIGDLSGFRTSGKTKISRNYIRLIDKDFVDHRYRSGLLQDCTWWAEIPQSNMDGKVANLTELKTK